MSEDFEEVLRFKQKRLAGISEKLSTSSNRFYNQYGIDGDFILHLTDNSRPLIEAFISPDEVQINIETISPALSGYSQQKISDLLYFLEVLVTSLDFPSSPDHLYNVQSKFFSFKAILDCPYKTMKTGTLLVRHLLKDLLYFHPCPERMGEIIGFDRGGLSYENENVDLNAFCRDYFSYIKRNPEKFESISKFSSSNFDHVETLLLSLLDQVGGKPQN